MNDQSPQIRSSIASSSDLDVLRQQMHEALASQADDHDADVRAMWKWIMGLACGLALSLAACAGSLIAWAVTG